MSFNELPSFLKESGMESELFLRRVSSCFDVDSSTSSVESKYAYTSTNISKEINHLEMTLAIIKPEAFEHREEIEKIMRKEHFKIIEKAVVRLTPEQASDFYRDHYGKKDFPKLVLSLSKGSMVVYCLCKDNAINDWKTLLGPADVVLARKEHPFSLRALYGDAVKNLNGLHGSDNRDKAEDEIHFFFPKPLIEPLRSEQERIDFLNAHVIPTVLEGLVELCRKKPADPLLWFADWLLENNPNKPRMVPELLLIPT